MTLNEVGVDEVGCNQEYGKPYPGHRRGRHYTCRSFSSPLMEPCLIAKYQIAAAINEAITPITIMSVMVGEEVVVPVVLEVPLVVPVVPVSVPPVVSVGKMVDGGIDTSPEVPDAPLPLFEMADNKSPSTVPGAAEDRFCPVVAVVAVVVVGSPVTSGFGLGAGMSAVPLPIGAAVGLLGAVVIPPPTIVVGVGVGAGSGFAVTAGAAAGAAVLTGLKSASSCLIHDAENTVGDPCS